MQTPLKIGIDFDGVIVDHRAHKLRLAGELGLALESWQTNTNVMGDYMKEEDYAAVQKPLYAEMTVLAPAVVGALETLASLPCEIYVVSARRPENTAPARAWMVKNGLHAIVPPERVIFCARGREKQEHCERLGLSVFLDDKISYLGHLDASIKRVLFDEDGIAQRIEIPPEFEIVRSWPEFAALAAALAAEPV